MKKMHCILLLEITVLLTGCFPSNLSKSNIQQSNNAIQTAIEDFSKIKKLYKKESVFSVSMQKRWKGEDLLVIRIIKNGTIFSVSAENLKQNTFKLPTQYLIKDGKLFYWWNEDSVLSKETLAVYKKYGIIKYDESGLAFNDHVNDDFLKGADYFFCKNDPTKFKRIITNKGYYPPPKMDCNSIIK